MYSSRKLTTREQLDALKTLVGEDQIESALEALEQSGDLEVVRLAIDIVRTAERPEFRDNLLPKFDWCQAQPHRRPTASRVLVRLEKHGTRRISKRRGSVQDRHIFR